MEVAEFPTFDLEGQVALVTGASRGIGHDLALALAHAGANVAVTARAVDDLREVSERIAAEGSEAHPLGLDLRDLPGVERAVAGTVERFGKLDVLVSNAGVGTNHDAIDATEEEWDGAGYRHEAHSLYASGDPAHVAMPRVHRVASLLKRWLLGTHQGAVRPQQLDYYLDEFTFRLNRRGSNHRGLLFLEQAVQTEPKPLARMLGGAS